MASTRSFFDCKKRSTTLPRICPATPKRARSPPPALFAHSLIGRVLLIFDRSHYHNNRYALFLFAFLLAFAPCDRAFTFGRRPPADRKGPLWAQRLATVQLAMIYIGSGGS